jgi:hypothetical protein
MTGGTSSEPLLAPDALSGLRIAISASESPDLARLGLVETHFRLALAEIARAVLLSGGKLCYGGHLDPSGYTSMLVQELQRYSRRDKPLRICLAWQEHRNLSEEEFEAVKADLGLYGEIVCLDPDGKPFTWERGRKGAPASVTDVSLRQKSLSALREFMVSQTQGRVLIGGRREGFQGRIPGLVEEAAMSMQASQPLYLAGGFGGVTTDIVKAIGLDDGAWLPSRTDGHAGSPRLAPALVELSNLSKEAGSNALANGLSDDENRRLAATRWSSTLPRRRCSKLLVALPVNWGRYSTRY